MAGAFPVSVVLATDGAELPAMPAATGDDASAPLVVVDTILYGATVGSVPHRDPAVRQAGQAPRLEVVLVHLLVVLWGRLGVAEVPLWWGGGVAVMA